MLRGIPETLLLWGLSGAFQGRHGGAAGDHPAWPQRRAPTKSGIAYLNRRWAMKSTNTLTFGDRLRLDGQIAWNCPWV